jgi:hypothetical protein
MLRLKEGALAVSAGRRRAGSACLLHSYRAAVYERNGKPQEVLKSVLLFSASRPSRHQHCCRIEEGELKAVSPNEVRIRLLAAPINPSDINQVASAIRVHHV